MGWTSYHATNYKNGKVDRKAEMDKLFIWSNDHIEMKVLKSSMVSTIYYAAVEEIRDGQRTVFAAVCITGGADRYDPYFNFHTKTWMRQWDPVIMTAPKAFWIFSHLPTANTQTNGAGNAGRQEKTKRP